MRRFFLRFITVCVSMYLLFPSWALAAGGKASPLIVVADTRRLDSGLWRYFADLYNTNPWMFALWAAILTALYGAFLGWIMDLIMSRTGLDLKSRKIVEH